MKLVFAHDHVFIRDPRGLFYSPGRFPYAAWERYLAHFQELTVVSRARFAVSKQEMDSLDLSSGPHVHFSPIDNISSLQALISQGKVKERLRTLLESADAAVVRFPSEVGNIVFDVATELNLPFAAEVVGCGWDVYWYHGSRRARLFAPLAHLRQRRRVRSADRVLYVTENFLQQRYPTSAVSTNCSNVQLLPASQSGLDARIERLARQGPRKIGFIGFLGCEYKGLGDLLRALADVKGWSPLLEVVGSGPQDRWKHLAASLELNHQIRFLGHLPRQRVAAWLDTIDIYVQPSHTEGLPRALIEAMSRGIPCFGSTAGGIPELLDPDCLHSAGDPAGITRLLTRAGAESDWLVGRAQKNFEVSQRFAPDRLVETRRAFWSEFAAMAAARRGWTL